jgi:hypothetical protein
MIITTRVKSNWVELTIEDSNTVINYDVWKHELQDVKLMLQSAIEDIDYMINKVKELNDETDSSR